ncbi:hypothetical protein J6590_006948 [Homalodisca vitripennis]|nr:hypothetical protein J6590_006948 [Homalodisca vitripennis]
MVPSLKEGSCTLVSKAPYRAREDDTDVRRAVIKLRIDGVPQLSSRRFIYMARDSSPSPYTVVFHF